MADWRQIQARIRKAKLSADPVPALTRIYDRTRDGLAAFELASVHESAGRTEEAVGWYSKAWQRFRRADWKQKASDAVVRLGGEAPLEVAGAEPVTASRSEGGPMEGSTELDSAAGDASVDELASASAKADSVADENDEGDADQPATNDSAAQPGDGPKKRSRRGRRGGRRHRARRERQLAKQQPGTPGQDTPAQAESTSAAETQEAAPAPPSRPPAQERGRGRDRGRGRGREREREPRQLELPSRETEVTGPRVGSEFAAQARTVDPGLASRMARLESMLRRLMASPIYSMADADEAPAGPGVFVLSDSDHTTYYYVEACRTLRIAITNIARARAGEGSIKKGLAEHLGISESQVSKYIKDHCVVRWLQLDEGASRLAHFATAVLGPVLNE